MVGDRKMHASETLIGYAVQFRVPSEIIATADFGR
jgi:hypothetical protein